MKFSLIGPGRVGRALAKRLVQAGWQLCGVASRSLESAAAAVEWIGAGKACGEPSEAVSEADVVFITVPDGAIASVCRAIADTGGFCKGAAVLHTSGAVSSEALAPARDLGGCAVGSMHPLQSFASPQEALRLLPGTYFCVEGDPAALEAARSAIELLAGRMFTIEPEAKGLYHAGACVASNYLVSLADVAVELLRAAGIPAGTALEMLLPLIRGTVSNLERIGLPHALTGPIARGDTATVRKHIEEIRCAAPQLLEFYELLACRTQAVAERMREGQ